MFYSFLRAINYYILLLQQRHCVCLQQTTNNLVEIINNPSSLTASKQLVLLTLYPFKGQKLAFRRSNHKKTKQAPHSICQWSKTLSKTDKVSSLRMSTICAYDRFASLRLKCGSSFFALVLVLVLMVLWSVNFASGAEEAGNGEITLDRQDYFNLIGATH